MAKSFHQQSGLDYGETFSLVIKPTIVYTVCSLAISKGWSIWQLDMNNAFLSGFLLRRSTWNNLQGLSIPLILIMYASFTAVFMALNRLRGPDFLASAIIWS